jgi:CubicO group peptidase (beta-lactamase class C family)
MNAVRPQPDAQLQSIHRLAIEMSIYSVRGGGEQMVYVIPPLDMVVVTTSDTDIPDDGRFDSLTFGGTFSRRSHRDLGPGLALNDPVNDQPGVPSHAPDQ